MKDHEVAYNAASWDAMSARLDAQDKKSNKAWVKWSVAAFALLLIGSSAMFIDEESSNDELVQNNPKQLEKEKRFLSKTNERLNNEIKSEEELVEVKPSSNERQGIEKNTLLVREIGKSEKPLVEKREEKTAKRGKKTNNSKTVKTSVKEKTETSEKASKEIVELITEESGPESRVTLKGINRLTKKIKFSPASKPQAISEDLVTEDKKVNRQVEYLLFNPWNQLAVVGNFDERLRLDFENNWTNDKDGNQNDLNAFAQNQFTMSYETVLGINGNQGFGVFYQNRKESDWLKNNRLALIYSYIVDNKERGKLTISPSLGYRQNNYNQSYWRNSNVNDDTFLNTFANSETPEDSSAISMSIGVNYEIKQFFLYLNSYNLASQSVGKSGNYEELSSHYILGYHIPLSTKLTLTPILSASQRMSDMLLSPKVFIDIDEVLTAGVSYENMEQARFYIGTKFANRWNAQASFGLNKVKTTSDITRTNGFAQFGLYYQLSAR